MAPAVCEEYPMWLKGAEIEKDWKAIGRGSENSIKFELKQMQTAHGEKSLTIRWLTCRYAISKLRIAFDAQLNWTTFSNMIWYQFTF